MRWLCSFILKKPLRRRELEYMKGYVFTLVLCMCEDPQLPSELEKGTNNEPLSVTPPWVKMNLYSKYWDGGSVPKYWLSRKTTLGPNSSRTTILQKVTSDLGLLILLPLPIKCYEYRSVCTITRHFIWCWERNSRAPVGKYSTKWAIDLTLSNFLKYVFFYYILFHCLFSLLRGVSHAHTCGG